MECDVSSELYRPLFLGLFPYKRDEFSTLTSYNAKQLAKSISSSPSFGYTQWQPTGGDFSRQFAVPVCTIYGSPSPKTLSVTRGCSSNTEEPQSLSMMKSILLSSSASASPYASSFKSSSPYLYSNSSGIRTVAGILKKEAAVSYCIQSFLADYSYRIL